MNASEIRERLNNAALTYMERRNLSVPASYWIGLERRLIEPAAANLTAGQATDEQIDGSVKKLEFLLGKVFEETHTYIHDWDPFLEDGLGEETVETVVVALMSGLSPFWPFSD